MVWRTITAGVLISLATAGAALAQSADPRDYLPGPFALETADGAGVCTLTLGRESRGLGTRYAIEAADCPAPFDAVNGWSRERGRIVIWAGFAKRVWTGRPETPPEPVWTGPTGRERDGPVYRLVGLHDGARAWASGGPEAAAQARAEARVPQPVSLDAMTGAWKARRGGDVQWCDVDFYTAPSVDEPGRLKAADWCPKILRDAHTWDRRTALSLTFFDRSGAEIWTGEQTLPDPLTYRGGPIRLRQEAAFDPSPRTALDVAGRYWVRWPDQPRSCWVQLIETGVAQTSSRCEAELREVRTWDFSGAGIVLLAAWDQPIWRGFARTDQEWLPADGGDRRLQRQP